MADHDELTPPLDETAAPLDEAAERAQYKQGVDAWKAVRTLQATGWAAISHEKRKEQGYHPLAAVLTVATNSPQRGIPTSPAQYDTLRAFATEFDVWVGIVYRRSVDPNGHNIRANMYSFRWIEGGILVTVKFELLATAADHANVVMTMVSISSLGNREIDVIHGHFNDNYFAKCVYELRAISSRTKDFITALPVAPLANTSIRLTSGTKHFGVMRIPMAIPPPVAAPKPPAVKRKADADPSVAKKRKTADK